MYYRKVQIKSLFRQFPWWSFYGVDVTLPTLKEIDVYIITEKDIVLAEIVNKYHHHYLL